LKKLVTRWEGLIIGTSGPISVGENEPQRPDTGSDINIERGRAVCELDEIMQILPGSSDNAYAYKCITGDLQHDISVIAYCRAC
jgi:hypothetical protein